MADISEDKSAVFIRYKVPSLYEIDYFIDRAVHFQSYVCALKVYVILSFHDTRHVKNVIFRDPPACAPKQQYCRSHET